MAGPLGYAGALAGLRLVECPHCGHRQLRARGRRTLECKSCRKRFAPAPPRKPKPRPR